MELVNKFYYKEDNMKVLKFIGKILLTIAAIIVWGLGLNSVTDLIWNNETKKGGDVSE